MFENEYIDQFFLFCQYQNSFLFSCLSPLLIALGCGACLGAKTTQPQTVTVITNPVPQTV